ncbi:MAG: peptide chain release factor N(5)-glutamine methyltransferase [Bacteroidota bacterium]
MASIQQAHHNFVETLSPLYGQREARSMARIVFEDAFEVRNFQRQDALDQAQLDRLSEIQSRLLQSEPLQYIMGQADFYGFQLQVTPAVLIPRPETEELVQWVLESFDKQPLRVLDVGTGSGCIALCLKKKRPDWQVAAMDISQDALEVAQQNANLLEAEVHFFQGDALTEELFAQADYELIVSNPPYIPPSERSLMPPQVTAHEPAEALFVPEEQPLLFYQRLAQQIRQRRKPCHLFVEINEHFSNQMKQEMEGMAFEEVQIRRDLQGKPRMLSARWPD